MNVSLAFTRIFFTLITVILFTTFSFAHPEGSPIFNAIIGLIGGLVFSAFLFGMDQLFKRFNLRSFNVVSLGLFFGYLMGLALNFIIKALFDISTLDERLSVTAVEIVKIAVFIIGLYLGTSMTIRAADELYVSVPFVKFAQATQKKKDILIDGSVLSDARIIDLCSSGVLDNHVVVPRFLIKELYTAVEIGDEASKAKAKRALDVLKKLEAVTHLELRYNDTDFPDIKDSTSKLLRLARLIDANLLTADISRVQMHLNHSCKQVNSSKSKFNALEKNRDKVWVISKMAQWLLSTEAVTLSVRSSMHKFSLLNTPHQVV